jgi:hypothetical protein
MPWQHYDPPQAIIAVGRTPERPERCVWRNCQRTLDRQTHDSGQWRSLYVTEPADRFIGAMCPFHVCEFVRTAQPRISWALR